MGAVVTSLKSGVARRFVPMTAVERLRKLVKNKFIVGKTVDEAKEEYPDIWVRVIGRRSASGEHTEIRVQLTYCDTRVDVLVDENGVIVELFGVG